MQVRLQWSAGCVICKNGEQWYNTIYASCELTVDMVRREVKEGMFAERGQEQTRVAGVNVSVLQMEVEVSAFS